jgi:TonB family protein
MAPITKDPDTLTAPESPPRSGSTTTESAVKAQPVALEIPITVNGVRTAQGSDKREPFSESTKTVMVFGSGAVIRLTSAMAPGQLLFLTNEHTKKEVVCQVVKSKNYRNASGYVELEFTEPAVGFWGMRFPGDRIGPGPQAAPAETRTPTAGNGAPTPVPVRPAAPKTEQPATSSAPSASVNAAARPSAPAPSVSKPASPAKANSTVVPPAIDAAALPGTTKAKPDAKVPAAPIATSLGADTPLVEPWLKKREPAPRVPAAPPSVARRAPQAPASKPAEPESSLTPTRSFATERSSERPASLFAPTEAPANLANVDLSSLTPFFEVKPAASDAPAAAPKTPAASDREPEELKQQTARLQDELAKMQFAETDSSATVKAETEKPEAEAEKPAAPELEISAFPLTEQSIETLKTELVHENAVRLLESPEPSDAAPVLPEVSRLEELLSVEPPAVIPAPSATIPALEPLEQEEMKIPAWLAPLARNTSASSSAQEPVLREKTKRRSEQPPLQELVAPLVAPAEEQRATGSRVPQFGSALPFEGAKSGRRNAPKKSGKGMLLGGIAAGILALAGGGWWYVNQQAPGARANTATAGSTVVSGPQDLQTPAIKESVLGTTPARQTEATVSEAKAAAANSNAPSNLGSKASSPAPASSAANSARGPQVSAGALNGGNVATNADSAEPGPVQAVEKPTLGEVHLAAPKIAQKRTVQAGAAPDAVLSEEQPGTDADSPGSGLGIANNQPAAPAAPLAVGGDVKQAKLISSVQPAYPTMAKTQRISGAVTIDALIDAEGRVTTMKVMSGPALLQEAAKDALKQWKYEPATLDGKAVPMHLTVTLQFRLQE